MNIIKKAIQEVKDSSEDFKFYLQRETPFFGDGKQIGEPCNMAAMKKNPEADETLFGDSIMLYSERGLDKIVAKGKETMALMSARQADGGEAPSPNFIVDYVILHNKPRINPEGVQIPNNEIISEEQCRTSAHSLHDACRNQGVHYHPNGVDTGINVGLGNIYYVNGHDVWGDVWDDSVQYGDSEGVKPSTIMEYCKKNVTNTWGDGSRYTVFVFPRLSHSGTVTGFAYVGVAATHKLAGNFTRYTYTGHKDYRREGDPEFGRFLLLDNKTIIHEFFHSLGLYHTFHGSNSCDEVHGPTQGDRIADTKVHTRTDSCGFSVYENPRNNYMSYSSSKYRVVITEGQKARMLAVIANQYPLVFDNPYYDWDAENPVEPILGCTDPEATNYNSQATQNDGSCEYALPPVLGCTDPLATNYNPLATENDGSCVYPTDEPTYLEDRVNTIGAKHYFALSGLNGFIGEIFRVKNANGVEIPIINDECGNANIGCILSRMIDNEYKLVSITDQITGLSHAQNDMPLILKDGKIALDFTKESYGLRLRGIEWEDYFISMYQYQQNAVNNIDCRAVKRKGYPNSPFIIVSRQDKGLCWHNTQDNKHLYGENIKTKTYNQISASRDAGLYVNLDKVFDAGSASQGINTEELVIGTDPSDTTRMSGDYVFEVVIKDASLSELEIKNFNFSTEQDYSNKK